jgi:hypothetical protein
MIDERTLWHFRREVEFQCEVALHAFDGFERCFEQVDDTFAVRVFVNIHAMMSAAAAISRMLFSTKNSERARALCEDLGVSEESILLSRGMRNHFEHFDERLDEWLPSTVDGSLIDMVASTERIDEAGPRHTLRMFNISTLEVTFADETLALRPLAEAIRSLLQACRSRETASHSPSSS